MMKQVIKYSIKLFLMKGKFSMVFRFQLNNIGVNCQFRTKSQLVYILTKRIVNIDIINKTIPKKEEILSVKSEKIKIQPLNMVFK